MLGSVSWHSTEHFFPLPYCFLLLVITLSLSVFLSISIPLGLLSYVTDLLQLVLVAALSGLVLLSDGRDLSKVRVEMAQLWIRFFRTDEANGPVSE